MKIALYIRRCLFFALLILTFSSKAAPKGGDVDPTFNTVAIDGASSRNNIAALAVQADGRALIGGNFRTVGGVNRDEIARLNSDGSLDTNYLNGMSGAIGDSGILTIMLQPDGKALIGGDFFCGFNDTQYRGIARLNTDGSLDTNFQHGMGGVTFNTVVRAIALQTDSKVVIGGDFNTVNGVTRYAIARLNTDGSLDTGFTNGIGANDRVLAIAIQPDGKVLIGGAFDAVNGVTRNGIARLNSDGSLDTGFQNGMAGIGGGTTFNPSYVHAIAVQPDGKVLIGGYFDSLNGKARSGLARLNTNGSLDTAYENGTAGIDGSPYAFKLLSNGKLLVVGGFDEINGVSRNGIAQLNPDGTVDGTFANGLSGADNLVSSSAVQDDGNILVCGYFSAINGVSIPNVARLYGIAPPFLGDFGVVSNGFGFTLSGESNSVVVVEGSADMTSWTPLQTNTLGSLPVTFSDSDMEGITKRFYRARFQ
jgi:uncharacterized delta-60 repeat protein